jgi:hypothetical protein
MTDRQRLAALVGREFLPAARTLRLLMQARLDRPPVRVTVTTPHSIGARP